MAQVIAFKSFSLLIPAPPGSEPRASLHSAVSLACSVFFVTWAQWRLLSAFHPSSCVKFFTFFSEGVGGIGGSQHDYILM